MQEFKSMRNINNYKPKMKTIANISFLKINVFKTLVMVKADGEFSLARYSKDEAYTVNRWQKGRRDFPALNEFSMALEKAGIKEAEVLCELYAMSEGKPLKLPKFIHYVKSGDPELVGKVHLGVWDLVSLNGHEIREPYIWKIGEIGSWLEGCRLVHVLPYITPSRLEEVKKFWKQQVEELGYEGLVVRERKEIWKVKPENEVDVVIIAVQKKPLLKMKQVTSVRTALMDRNGYFIELTDVGISSKDNGKLRKLLYELLDFKVGEDSKLIYVKPVVICKVIYNEVYKVSNDKPIKKNVYSFDESGYKILKQMSFVSLRHPRLDKNRPFRSDKKVTHQDLRLSQIPM